MRGDTLNIRLRCIADLIPVGSRVVDVGTDHAKLPAHLAHTGRASRVIATDIAEGPLKSAAKELERTGVENVELRLCDGLKKVDADEVDVVVIAGMGGENIRDILSRAPWAKSKLCLLQPMTRPEALREFLYQNGYRIHAERLCRDSGRIYSIITANAGENQPVESWEKYLSRALSASDDALLGEYLAKTVATLKKKIYGARLQNEDEHEFEAVVNQLEEYL